MAVIHRLLGAATLLAAVAIAPGVASVQATYAGQADSSAGVLCAGELNLNITEVDGRAVTPTKRVDLVYGPTPSTFSLSHRITVRNDASVPLRGLTLTTLLSARDNAALTRMLRARVQMSSDGFRTSTDTGDIRLSDLQKSASRPVPSPAAVGKSRTVEVQITFSATGLDNSVAGGTVSPAFVFIGSD